MFKHILLPTDGSELSQKAARDCITLAKTLNAKVTGVHIIPSTFSAVIGFDPDVPWIDVELQERMREAATAAGNKYLDGIEAQAKSAGVKFERLLIESNHIWKGIVDAAKDQRCDLIMMAAHGRRGLSALVLGSETNKVLTHTNIPVLVYR